MISGIITHFQEKNKQDGKNSELVSARNFCKIGFMSSGSFSYILVFNVFLTIVVIFCGLLTNFANKISENYYLGGSYLLYEGFSKRNFHGNIEQVIGLNHRKFTSNVYREKLRIFESNFIVLRYIALHKTGRASVIISAVAH